MQQVTKDVSLLRKQLAAVRSRMDPKYISVKANDDSLLRRFSKPGLGTVLTTMKSNYARQVAAERELREERRSGARLPPPVQRDFSRITVEEKKQLAVLANMISASENVSFKDAVSKAMTAFKSQKISEASDTEKIKERIRAIENQRQREQEELHRRNGVVPPALEHENAEDAKHAAAEPGDVSVIDGKQAFGHSRSNNNPLTMLVLDPRASFLRVVGQAPSVYTGGNEEKKRLDEEGEERRAREEASGERDEDDPVAREPVQDIHVLDHVIGRLKRLRVQEDFGSEVEQESEYANVPYQCPSAPEFVDLVVKQHEQTDEAELAQSSSAPHVLAVSSEGEYRRTANLVGYQTFVRMRAVMPQFYMNNRKMDTRSPAQAELHSKLTTALLPVIYRADWDLMHREICKMHGLEREPKTMTLVDWVRRSGKSIGVAMELAALSMFDPGPLTVAVASTNVTAVSEMLRYVFIFIDQKKELIPEKVVKIRSSSSRPTLVVFVKGRSQFEGVTFLGIPKGDSNASNIRGGRKVDVVVLDEAGFATKSMYTGFLLPIARLDKTNVILVSSTSKDPSNAFNNFKFITDEFGECAFNYVSLDLICPECKAKNKTECIHYKNKQPKWFDTGKNWLIKEMYKLVSFTDYLAEFVGTTMDIVKYCFDHRKLVALGSMPGVYCGQTSIIFTFVDFGGGSTSDSAIVSICVQDDGTVVVSGEYDV